MTPVEFEEQNGVLRKPDNMTDEECLPLPCYRDGFQVISKWKLSEQEKKHVLEHGWIWVNVLGGATQPPILAIAQEKLPKIF